MIRGFVSAVIAGALAAITADLPYTIVKDWGQLPAGSEWGEVSGVTIDRQGTIYAFHRTEPPILQFDSTGKLLKAWGEGMFAQAHGLRIDRNGFLWATDARGANGKGQQVFKFDPQGRVVLTLGTKGVSGEGPDTFNGPCDVAVAANGDVFVADGHVNARVVKFSSDGKFLKAWGKKGEGPGEFNVPHAIVIDSRGRVLVGDRGNRRIQIFDQDGKFLDQWTQFGRPSGLFIAADDTLYVGDIEKGIAVGSARDGSVKGMIVGALPEGIAVAADGAVYAGETTTGRSLKKLVLTSSSRPW